MDKGKTLAIMGKSFFYYLGKSENWQNLFSHEIIKETFAADYLKELENSLLYKQYCENGVSHHAILDEKISDTPYLRVKKISIIRPIFNGEMYNYEAFEDRPVHTLVPLEVIFRLGLPPGNSLSKRTGIRPSEKLLKRPILDFSTKLEKGDRYLDYGEAQTISGVNIREWTELHQMTHLIALNLFYFHHTLGLELWDGKIEVAFMPGQPNKRSFMLVDSIGIDELRLVYKGKSFSKEFLRENYKNSIWYKKLEAAKLESFQTGGDFKQLCMEKYNSAPEELSRETKERAEAVYKSYTNAVTDKIIGRAFFEEKYNLDEYSKRYL